MNENTRWIVGTGIVLLIAIIASVYTGVSHLTGLQTEMNRQLRENIAASEGRVTQRIDEVDKRLTDNLRNVATDLRTVEGETAPLAGLEVRLTEAIQASEVRLSQGLQETEGRLTKRIDKIDDRLLEVEGESARLAAIVKTSSVPSPWMWPAGKGTIGEVMAGVEKAGIAAAENRQVLTNPMVESWLENSGMEVELFVTPAPNLYSTQILREAYIQFLEKEIAALKAARPTDNDAEDTTKSE